MQRNFIEGLEKEGNNRINEKQKRIGDLSDFIEKALECNSKNEGIVEQLNSKSVIVSTSSDKLKKLGTLKGKLSQRIGMIHKDLNFFSENSVCPTCTQEIDDDFKQTKIDEYQKSSSELTNAFAELNDIFNFGI